MSAKSSVVIINSSDPISVQVLANHTVIPRKIYLTIRGRNATWFFSQFEESYGVGSFPLEIYYHRVILGNSASLRHLNIWYNLHLN